MKGQNHIKYTNKDYDELMNGILDVPPSRDSVIWRERYVIRQGLSALRNATRFTLTTKDNKFEFDNTLIRRIIIDNALVEDVVFALNTLQVAPGNGRPIKFAVFFFIFLLIREDVIASSLTGTITRENVKQIFMDGMAKAVLEGKDVCTRQLYCGEVIAGKEFKDAIENLREYLEVTPMVSVHDREKQKPSNYFPLPKSIFRLGFSSGEIIVYSYLMYCEDRKTYKCYPSYRTIGDAVGMSINTVRKYVDMLERKGFIQTEHTTVMTKDGRTHNGSLMYTLQPIRPIEEVHFENQLRKARARRDAKIALEKFDKKRGKIK